MVESKTQLEEQLQEFLAQLFTTQQTLISVKEEKNDLLANLNNVKKEKQSIKQELDSFFIIIS